MRTLFFTAAYNKEIRDNISVYENMNLLFSNFSILEFTSSLNEITVIFQSFNPDSKVMKPQERKTLRRKTKTLELYLILDYEKIMNGTDPENLNHIKEVFLKGCETFLKPLKDFRWEEFNDEIQKIINR